MLGVNDNKVLSHTRGVIATMSMLSFSSEACLPGSLPLLHIPREEQGEGEPVPQAGEHRQQHQQARLPEHLIDVTRFAQAEPFLTWTISAIEIHENNLKKGDESSP